MPKLLLIDDEPNIRFSIEQVFADDERVEVITAQNAEEGLKLANEESPDVILLDIRLGEHNGLELFDDLRRADPKRLIIFITGHGTSDTAIDAIKRGAHDYLVKPLDANELVKVVEQAFEISRLMNVPAFVTGVENLDDVPDQLVGQGPAMQTVCKEIGRVAAQHVNVLILGESGTGKELVARAIYHHSRRSKAPFLAINCAAIPEALLESELFGHERGAFTGADHRRIGRFEQCHHGTLFLDEIGDMAINTQAKILRLLEERCFERVGGKETINADVRIISATNQNLETSIDQGRFRKDLYYRLRGVVISLPPLRDRREDIPQLAHHFLFRFNRELGVDVRSISHEMMDRLIQYDWPGNVRELQSVIRESLLRAAGAVLLPEFLPVELRPRTGSKESGGTNMTTFFDSDWQEIPRLVEGWLNSGETDLYRRALEHFDRLLIARILQQTNGNQARASELLGLSRVTLRSKLRSMGLSVEKVVAPQAAS